MRMRDRPDRGSVSVELAILAPAFGLMIAFVVLVGRTQSARADIEAAAHSAARSITLSRDPAAAAELARQQTAVRLDVGSPECRSMGWEVNLDAAEATVTISCEVDLSEAALLPVPGVMAIEASRTEVFDRFREGGPT
jgi:Flp pilus assembly protein TadG